MNEHGRLPRPNSSDRSAVRRMSRREFLGLGAAGAAGLALAGCGTAGGSQDGGGGRLKIVYQPGTTTYAQLVIMEKEGWLAEDLPDYDVSWTQVDAGAAVRDAMVNGEADVGAGGIGPFLVGYDSGIDWRILSALNDIEMWLMVNDDKYRSLGDFGPEDKIAVVAPDSIQAVILRKAAEEELGDPRALDSNLVSLPSPDSFQALMSGQISGHFTAPPYQFQEQDEGARPIVRSFDLFGRHNLISIWVLGPFHDANPQAMEALYSNFQRATKLIQDDPGRVAEILAGVSRIDPADEERFLTEENVFYTTAPHGFISFGEFMQSAGLIDQTPGSWKDLVYPNLKRADGS